MLSKLWGLVGLMICISGSFFGIWFGEQSETPNFVESLHRKLDDPGREYAIEVQIATGLTNVLQGLGKRTTSFGSIWKGPYDYGMIGEAKIVTYMDMTLR